MPTVFTLQVIEIIQNIPPGKVSTYGMIATLAGNSSGARQVARILHSSSKKYSLPWHRVVNRNGAISLKPGRGYELQKAALEKEGIRFDCNGIYSDHCFIDLDKYLWDHQE